MARPQKTLRFNDMGKKPEKDKSINEQEEWQAIRSDWAKQKIGNAQAHLDAFFETSDDMPLSRHLLLVSISAFFVIFVLWANWAALDEVTRGEGKVVPSSEVQVVQSLDSGIVDDFFVKEGDDLMLFCKVWRDGKHYIF